MQRVVSTDNQSIQWPALSTFNMTIPARRGFKIMISTLYQKAGNAFGMAALQLGTQTPIPFPKFEKKSSYHVHPLDPEMLVALEIFIGAFVVFGLVLALNTIRSAMRQRRLDKLLPQNFTSQRERRTKRRKQRKNAQKIQKSRRL